MLAKTQKGAAIGGTIGVVVGVTVGGIVGIFSGPGAPVVGPAVGIAVAGLLTGTAIGLVEDLRDHASAAIKLAECQKSLEEKERVTSILIEKAKIQTNEIKRLASEINGTKSNALKIAEQSSKNLESLKTEIASVKLQLQAEAESKNTATEQLKIKNAECNTLIEQNENLLRIIDLLEYKNRSAEQYRSELKTRKEDFERFCQEIYSCKEWQYIFSDCKAYVSTSMEVAGLSGNHDFSRDVMLAKKEEINMHMDKAFGTTQSLKNFYEKAEEFSNSLGKNLQQKISEFTKYNEYYGACIQECRESLTQIQSRLVSIREMFSLKERSKVICQNPAQYETDVLDSSSYSSVFEAVGPNFARKDFSEIVQYSDNETDTEPCKIS